jgi:hypothetical protein
MKKSRFTESQILAVLRQAEVGCLLPDLCREHGISVTIRRVPHLFDLHAALGAMFCCFFQFQGSNS